MDMDSNKEVDCVATEITSPVHDEDRSAVEDICETRGGRNTDEVVLKVPSLSSLQMQIDETLDETDKVSTVMDIDPKASGSDTNSFDVDLGTLVCDGKDKVLSCEALISVKNSTEQPLSVPTPDLDKEVLETVDQMGSNDEKDGVPLEISTSQSHFDTLSIHRGGVVPYSDTEDSDSSSSTTSFEDSSDESSESESVSEKEDQGHKEKSNPCSKPIRAQGELDIDDLPPIQDLQISVRNDEVSEIGKVLHAVDTLVVVESYKDQPPLDIDSVLFLDRGARPLGKIFDVMGPVTEPLYSVRFNSKEHIEENNIKPGMPVYCAPQTEHSNFVFLQHLLRMKGSDASWKKDLEAPVAVVEFSDDEEEAKAKKGKNTVKAHHCQKPDEPVTKAPRVDQHQSTRTQRFNTMDHPSNQGAGRGNIANPRNPWSWSGSRTHNRHSSSADNQEPSFARGSVRPSSFHSAPQNSWLPHGSLRNQNAGGNRYLSQSQFGREPDPRSFGQLPNPSMGNNSSQWHVGPRHPGNAYTNMNHGPPPDLRMCGPSMQDQRYFAFQSQIARLVDAYNRGVDSPSGIPQGFGPIPPHAPPYPPAPSSSHPDEFNFSYHNHFSG